MTKRSGAFILFFLVTGWVSAQDMPPLPPMADQSQASAKATPPSPAAQQPATDQQSSPNNGGSPALPPLPSQGQSATSSAAPASSDNGGLPPVPNQDATATPAATTEAGSTTETASATPAATPAAGQPVKKHAKKLKPWEISKWRPSVIFAGWIAAKGGNEYSRLAWASQEVQNALLFKGYKLVKEDGRYEGDRTGYQWREFTFNHRKSKSSVQVYLRPMGKKVWMRVGPSEPPAPAVYNLAQVQKMRKADLAALHLLKKKFGRRLAPRRMVSDWNAPYDYAKDEVVK